MHKRIALVAFLAVPIGPLARLLSTDPCELQAELTPSVLEGGDQAGWSVASEGSRLVLGSPQHSDKGGVFIYSFDGSSWDLDSTIIPNQLDVGDQFGFSISLSGGLLAVSAIGDDTIAPDAGAVYIFEEISSTQWAIQQTLYPTVPGFNSAIQFPYGTIRLQLESQRLSACTFFRQSGQDWVEEGDEDGPPFDSPGIPGLTVIGSSFGEAVAVYQDTLLVGDDDLTISTPQILRKLAEHISSSAPEVPGNWH